MVQPVGSCTEAHFSIAGALKGLVHSVGTRSVIAEALASRGVAAYFEWIDSEANPADPLSRLGFDDEWVQGQLRDGRWRKWHVTPPPCFGHGPTLLDLVFQLLFSVGLRCFGFSALGLDRTLRLCGIATLRTCESCIPKHFPSPAAVH